MTTDLTPIILGVIAIISIILTTFVAPWLNSKLTAEETAELLRWVDIAVGAAQQLYHNLDGEARLEYALSCLAQQGYDVSEQTVLDAVEAAVLKLHQQIDPEK